MPATAASGLASRATGSSGARMPGAAQRLRLPLHARSQQRMAARWGFDLNARDARERAEALLSELPDDVDRLLLAASIRSSRGDDAGALVAAHRAVELDERSSRARSTLAALLARNGDTAAAAANAEAAVDLDPEDPAALYNRGLTRWTLGDRHSAREDFDRAATLLGLPSWRWWRRRAR